MLVIHVQRHPQRQRHHFRPSCKVQLLLTPLRSHAIIIIIVVVFLGRGVEHQRHMHPRVDSLVPPPPLSPAPPLLTICIIVFLVLILALALAFAIVASGQLWR